ncbi:sugar phosphate isomerase/epimerase family protein [Ruania alba]|uniref:Sugar phosphate isomerase/epimerase n=1 Tax=Ruania alba TaxID=648782 RepID=A0A1H5H518_9MICO|nr:sugar phosphate isomerase/epimerase [Ruania alba]SEE23077.1 Sugar phosphate isomerase/epimerase [Ruania alba]
MTDRPRLAPRTGINNQTVPAASAVEVIEGAARHGLGCVELTGEVLAQDPDGVPATLREQGVRLLGVSPTKALHGWHVQWDEQVGAGMRSEMQAAATAGAEFFVMPFMRPGGDADTVTAGLRRAVPIAREAGLRLAVEPIGHHEVLRRAEQLAPVLARLDQDVIGVLLDSFHFFRSGQSLEDLRHLDGVDVLAFQVSNANDRPVPELLGYRDRTFPLDGPFDVAGLCGQVARRWPNAPIVVEVIGEVAAATPTATGLQRAATQLRMLTELITREDARLV